MEIGLAVLLFAAMTALLYVLLSLKIARQVDLHIKEFYKTRIHADIQEFYREMEGYAALMENRIQRFKNLIEREEAILREKNHSHLPVLAESTPPQTEMVVRNTMEPKPAKSLAKSAKTITTLKAKAEKTKPSKTAAKVRRKAADKSPAQKSPPKAEPPVQVLDEAPKTPEKILPPENAESPVAKENAVPAQNSTVAMPPPSQMAENPDADMAIAEELIKDLFAEEQATARLREKAVPSVEKRAPEAKAATPPKAETVPAVAQFLGKLGKKLRPWLLAENPQASTARSALPNPASPKAERVSAEPAAKNPDFAELLRRAEQIKAQKQAERERAALEARAEFYAKGDSYRPAPRQSSQAATPPAKTEERNTLAVKTLDEETLRFLIDSLRKNTGYRKQALRALTENNIPLEEIARLSQIDLAELQLMRDLNRL
ncbi:MAG: hypothetical protein N2Z22_00825 [Turneriella sp.]|nr:hypothetical protein [Turneriella sp.]